MPLGRLAIYSWFLEGVPLMAQCMSIIRENDPEETVGAPLVESEEDGS